MIVIILAVAIRQVHLIPFPIITLEPVVFLLHLHPKQIAEVPSFIVAIVEAFIKVVHLRFQRQILF